MCETFISSYWWIACYCMSVLAYLFSCQQAPGCFQVLAIIRLQWTFLYKAFSGHVFIFLGSIPRNGIAGSHGRQKKLASFPRGLYNFPLLPAMYERSSCCSVHRCCSVHCCQCVGLSVFFHFSQSSGYIVISHLQFKPAFPWQLMLLGTFSCAFGHFFGEVPIQIFYSLFKTVFSAYFIF